MIYLTVDSYAKKQYHRYLVKSKQYTLSGFVWNFRWNYLYLPQPNMTETLPIVTLVPKSIPTNGMILLPV